MVTPHAGSRVNSQNSNLSWTRPFKLNLLEMNRNDGKPRGLRTGDRARVFSPSGEMVIEVKLTEDILQGTVSLHQGAWTEKDSSGIETGASANILTSTVPTRPSNGSRTHSVFVQIEKIKHP
jgi:anaerobic selenocysteine-containing dehydrogenase